VGSNFRRIRKKQGVSAISTVFRTTSFGRHLSDDEVDPIMVEKALSVMEGVVAPILKSIGEERRTPGRVEFRKLLYFIAIQRARIPSFRPMVFKIFDSVTREELAKAMETKEFWEKTLKEAGIAEDAPGAAYQSMLEFKQSGKYSVTVQTEWYIQQMFRAADHIFPTLTNRNGTGHSARLAASSVVTVQSSWKALKTN